MSGMDAEVRKFWDQKAEQLGVDPRATMRDVILRGMEIEAIGARLSSDDTLLDVGCGNAFGSVRFAQRCQSVLAVDYSDGMIAMATETIRSAGLDNVRVERGDVTAIGNAYREEFTAASSVRCLINLPTTEQQYGALAQLAATLVSDGRFFLIEGIEEHFAALNRMRRTMGLPDLPHHWHNWLFPKATLERELTKHFSIEEQVDFGEYYFLSRIMHPLLTAPDEPMFEGKANVVARDIWRTGMLKGQLSGISTLMLYVCRKR